MSYRDRRNTLRRILMHATLCPRDGESPPSYTVAAACPYGWCKTRWHEWPVEELLKHHPLPAHLSCPSCGRRMQRYQLRRYWRGWATVPNFLH